MISTRARRALPISRLIATASRSFRFETPDAYNKRWQWDFKYAFYTYPRDPEPTKVPKPEDSRDHDHWLGTYVRDFQHRYLPGLKNLADRGNRVLTPYEFVLLPAWTLLALQFFPLDFGFRLLTLLPLTILYTRVRDKVRDPKPEETFLLEMIHSNEVIARYFKVETMQVLDHECEYIPGFPDPAEFPEFQNKIFSGLIRVLQLGHAHDQGPLRLRRP